MSASTRRSNSTSMHYERGNLLRSSAKSTEGFDTQAFVAKRGSGEFARLGIATAQNDFKA